MQNFIALSIVAAAVAYMVWRSWKTIAAKKKSTGCGSCGSCSNQGDVGVKVTPLVTTIQPLSNGKK